MYNIIVDKEIDDIVNKPNEEGGEGQIINYNFPDEFETYALQRMKKLTKGLDSFDGIYIEK